MGTLSLNKIGRLFWLGRYTERTYTCLEVTKPFFEKYIDGEEADFGCYCQKLGILTHYENTADFCRRYFFDREDADSIMASIYSAYDNAVVLRETISSTAFSYIQMAVNAAELAIKSQSHGVELQWIKDDIMAFRGCIEETVEEEYALAALKAGFFYERLDLYLRLGCSAEQCSREFDRLFANIYKVNLNPDTENLTVLMDAFSGEAAAFAQSAKLVCSLENLLPKL